tara:strand:+ start:763 stop:1800 length:1038 start_codon:yes stop_codon:yes gene_type:complete
LDQTREERLPTCLKLLGVTSRSPLNLVAVGHVAAAPTFGAVVAVAVRRRTLGSRLCKGGHHIITRRRIHTPEHLQLTVQLSNEHFTAACHRPKGSDGRRHRLLRATRRLGRRLCPAGCPHPAALLHLTGMARQALQGVRAELVCSRSCDRVELCKGVGRVRVHRLLCILPYARKPLGLALGLGPCPLLEGREVRLPFIAQALHLGADPHLQCVASQTAAEKLLLQLKRCDRVNLAKGLLSLDDRLCHRLLPRLRCACGGSRAVIGCRRSSCRECCHATFKIQQHCLRLSLPRIARTLQDRAAGIALRNSRAATDGLAITSGSAVATLLWRLSEPVGLLEPCMCIG